MAQPFGVGDVVGGRYRITHHVVTSADQDIIFQAMDEVLERQVSVLLASRANTKQVATSAKELATGDRASAVQVLDLGLAQNRTYLISSLVDPNQLLDLVVPDSAPYVEPYFTDSLGSELFGQSRQMQPHTYDDDDEYYARLRADLSGGEGSQRFLPSVPGLNRRRPAFLDRVAPEQAEEPAAAPVEPAAPAPPARAATGATPLERLKDAGRGHGIDVTAQPSVSAADGAADSSGEDAGAAGDWWHKDFEVTDADPAADTLDVIEATLDALPANQAAQEVAVAVPPAQDEVFSSDDERSADADVSAASAEPEIPEPGQPAEDAAGVLSEQLPSRALPTLGTPHSADAGSPAVTTQPDTLLEGEEVIDNPPAEPDPTYDSRETPAPLHDHGSAPLIPPPPEPGTSQPEIEQNAASFTSLISAVPPANPTSFPSSGTDQTIGARSAHSDETSFSQDSRSQDPHTAASGSPASAVERAKGLVSHSPLPLTWIIATVGMVIVVVLIAVVLFSVLGGS